MSRLRASLWAARAPRARRATARWLLLGALAAFAAGPAPAAPNPFGFGSGAPWVFQSGYGAVADDPGFDHFTRVLPIGTSTLHLYATAGPDASAAGEALCEPVEGGSGDEICGMDVRIDVSGPAYISGFRPAGPPAGTGIVSFPTTFSSATRTLRLNSVRATDPIPAGAFKLGELDVTVTGGSGVAVAVSDSEMVLASRQVAAVGANVIAVPEPGETALLASALLGLSALAGLRRLRAD
jgi:hypothetical protein